MAMKKRTRLVDMLAHEVSIVDNAANKRRFAVVKNDGDEMLKSDTGAAKNSPVQISGDPAAVLAALSGALEKLVQVTSATEAAQKSGAPVPADVSTVVASIMADLEHLRGIAGADATAALTAAPDSVGKQLDHEEVAKIGAKMASSRLARFKGALDELLQLFGEVAGAQALEDREAATKAASDLQQASLVTEELGRKLEDASALVARQAVVIAKQAAVQVVPAIAPNAIVVESAQAARQPQGAPWPQDMSPRTPVVGRQHVPQPRQRPTF